MRRSALSKPGVTAIFRDAKPASRTRSVPRNREPLADQSPFEPASACRSRQVSSSSPAAHRSSDAR